MFINKSIKILNGDNNVKIYDSDKLQVLALDEDYNLVNINDLIVTVTLSNIKS